MKAKLIIYTLSLVVLFTSCKKEITNPVPSHDDSEINTLIVPDGFLYKIDRSISLKVYVNANKAIITVYGVNNFGETEIIYGNNDTTLIVKTNMKEVTKGNTINGVFEAQFSMPEHFTHLLIKHKADNFATTQVVEITNSTINISFNSSNKSSEILADGLMYGVNYDKEFFSIDEVSGDITMLADLDYKSASVCVDRLNNIVYYVSRYSPYKLFKYDVATEIFTEISTLNRAYYRMTYNHNDGFIYLSRNNYLDIIEPSTGQYIKSLTVTGLSNGGGDMDFDVDGELFIVENKKIYSTVIDEVNDIVTATRIGQKIPRDPTACAFDNDGLLWIASWTNNFVYLYDVVAGTYTTKSIEFSIGIIDLGSMIDVQPPIVDTDGDGVPDEDDDYPTDPSRAFNNYYPLSGFGTLGFEDLWPAKGDYDFNDLVLDYRFMMVTNASNNLVEIFSTNITKAFGAGFKNGFAFQFTNDNIAQADITVSGYDVQEGYISLSASGLEQGQSKPTIIVYDNAYNIMLHPGQGTGVNTDENAPYVTPDTINIYIDIVDNTYTLMQLDIANFNPFIIVNMDREVEVHLSDFEPTDLAGVSYFGTLNDDSDPLQDKYYKTINNLPWAINIADVGFDYPKEKIEITNAYNHFAEWAISNGVSYSDWYLSKPGYRNSSNIYEVPAN